MKGVVFIKKLACILFISVISIFSISNVNYSYATTKNTLKSIPEPVLSKHLKAVESVQEKVNFIGKNAMRVKETEDIKGIEDYLLDTKNLQDETIYIIRNIQRDYDTYKEEEDSGILLSLILSLTDYRLALEELEFYLNRDDTDKRYDAFIGFAVLKHRGDNIIDYIVNIDK